MLTEPLLERLTNMAMFRSPAEAVGLILPDERVVELPNRSLTAHNSFKVTSEDVKLVLEAHNFGFTEQEWADLTLWHSHPSGGVGPSRTDMQNRVPGVNHLVITLNADGTSTPSWY